jgi:4-amino-4-deoxy-L-arabinose transferase-like glycosyltransferase
MLGSRNQDYIYPLSHLLTSFKDPFLPYFDRSFEWIRIMGPWPILILGVGGILLNLKKGWKQVLLLFVWFISPIVIQSEFAKVFTARYILFTLPYLIILAASSFICEKKIISTMSTLVLFLFILLSLKFDYLLLTDVGKANLPRSERSGYLEEWTSGTGIREVAEYLKPQVKDLPAGRQVVVGTEGFFGTLPDGLQIYLSRYPQITVIGVGVIIDKVPTQLTESKATGNKTYLVINSSRFKIPDPETAGLNLIAAYPKAFRPEGIREYIQNGPRDNLLFYEVVRIFSVKAAI